jgi:hypothetical protein
MAMTPANSPCGPANPFAKGPRDARYVENIMEHAFLSDVLQHCWFIRHHRVEVIRPDVDAGGYDLVLEANGRVRHVQLKSYSAGGAKGAPKLINSRLRDHPDPCVVRISWKPDPETCRVALRYRYSERANWPTPVDGAKNFELKGAHFVPGTPAFFETPDLVDRLFGESVTDVEHT